MPEGFSYAYWRSQFTLLFGKVLKSEMRVSPPKSFKSQLQPSMDLTLKLKHVTIKVRSLLCGLIVRYLVVRRTFLLRFQGSLLS